MSFHHGAKKRLFPFASEKPAEINYLMLCTSSDLPLPCDSFPLVNKRVMMPLITFESKNNIFKQFLVVSFESQLFGLVD
jgi:hypothetical protein